MINGAKTAPAEYHDPECCRIFVLFVHAHLIHTFFDCAEHDVIQQQTGNILSISFKGSDQTALQLSRLAH